MERGSFETHFKALTTDLSILSLFVAEKEFAVSLKKKKKKCVCECVFGRAQATGLYNLPFPLISH